MERVLVTVDKNSTSNDISALANLNYFAKNIAFALLLRDVSVLIHPGVETWFHFSMGSGTYYFEVDKYGSYSICKDHKPNPSTGSTSTVANGIVSTFSRVSFQAYQIVKQGVCGQFSGPSYKDFEDYLSKLWFKKDAIVLNLNIEESLKIAI